MRLWIVSLVTLFAVGSAPAADPVDFAREIAPIFRVHCIACHGPEKQKSSLRLDRKSDALRGGDDGIVIVAGKSGDSPLIKRIRSTDKDQRMPPSGDALSEEQIQKLTKWIDAGAVWPTDDASTEVTHWAFQPVTRPPTHLSGDAIDRFIIATLKNQSLLLSPEADRATLIRRLKFDLLGLPPTPEEIATFGGDPSATAYETLVDRYLASPHFGERQARHWLDIVRFAESHGFETNTIRPNAWVYRDWVIRAFNDDLPYDRFVKNQLAGDLLGADTATGFLVAGAWDAVKSPDKELTAQQRADELHDMVATTSSTFLGLTVGCARCHAHKFDPIPQGDYYAIKAIFAGVQHGDRELADNDPVADHEKVFASRPNETIHKAKRPAIQTGRNVDRFAPVPARFVRFTVTATAGAEPCIDELEVFTLDAKPVNVAITANVTVSGTYSGNPRHQTKHINDGAYGNDRSWISNTKRRGWVVLEFTSVATIDRVVWSRDRTDPPALHDRLPTKYKIEVSINGEDWEQVASSADRASSSNTPMGYLGRMTKPEVTKMLRRGEVMQPGETVAPGSLSRIGKPLTIPADATDSQRRLALADWIVDPANPLAARTMANRIWQSHFGVGFVGTPSDLGRNGGTPTHPELLDWLASELVANGWKLKAMHKSIVMSATYRQSSRARDDGLNRDVQSRLLWRYPPRRLEAEAIRDTMLAVSGQLDLKMGGPGFDLFDPNTNYVKVYTPRKEFGPETFRRMIYWSKPRMQLDDTFGAFDCPDGGQIAPKRNVSTTPLQALNLLNSPFVLQQADAFADRLKREATTDSERCRRAFLLSFGREPTAEEVKGATKLAVDHGLSALCRALFNANELMYVR